MAVECGQVKLPWWAAGVVPLGMLGTVMDTWEEVVTKVTSTKHPRSLQVGWVRLPDSS